MSRTFNGTTDIVNATVTAVQTSWTMGAWVLPTGAGENSAGRILSVESGTTVRQDLAFGSASRNLRSQQTGTVGALSLATVGSAIPSGVWSCVFATFRLSDWTIRLFAGGLAAVIAELPYTTVTVGSGTPASTGTNARIGNNGTSAQTWAGRLARVFFDAREWTLDEMEAFRLGAHPINTGNLRGYWPLVSPTAAQASDLSGNSANGTVTGTALAEDPPIPTQWAAVA